MNPQNFTVPSDAVMASSARCRYCPRCNTTRGLYRTDVFDRSRGVCNHMELCQVCQWPVEVWVELMPWL